MLAVTKHRLRVETTAASGASSVLAHARHDRRPRQAAGFERARSRTPKSFHRAQAQAPNYEAGHALLGAC